VNHTDQNNDFFNDDVIDSIANGMPAERRAAYYREMRHFRSLPHDDEMLHIVSIQQFPMLMMVEIPQRLAIEREKLERATGECMVALQRTNERLARLPDEVAGGISPEAIAEKINESLRQQFLKSTIPQTGQALTAVAGEIKQAVAGLQQGTTKIVAAHRHAAHEALSAVKEIKSAISEVTTTARQATAELSSTYLHEYRWALGVLLVLALVLGLLFGIFLEGSGYLPSFEPTHETEPAAIPRTRR
jgi:methyl-accepting chemotaxis protein